MLLDLNSSLAFTTSYLNGPGIDDHLRQTNATTGVSYFLTDHLGTTSALTDSTGAVVETLNYDSFGNNAASTRTRYTYTGRERDPDTGLLYYRARFYDPQIGRFINEDPIGLEGGMNFFAYADNSPSNFTDPFGLQTMSWPPKKPLKFWDCEELIRGIWESMNTMQRRAQEIITDPQKLQWYHWKTPHPRFGSIIGHRNQYDGWKTRLSDQLKEWYDKCKDKRGPRPPCDAKKWAETPAPFPIIRESPMEKATRERSLRHQRIAIGAAAAGAIALSGVVLLGGTGAALVLAF